MRQCDLVRRRFIVTLLAFSLLANVALFFAQPDGSNHISVPPVDVRIPVLGAHPSKGPPARADLRSFAASLHNSALPDRLIRALLIAEIDEKFRDRTAALLPPKNPSLAWWQSDTTPVPLANRLALLALRREKSRLRLELLGPDPDALDDGSSLAPAKREAARLLAADYAEAIDAIEDGGISSRFLLPAEKAALASLEEQQKVELAALLTPAELADFELRTSSTTADIRDELHGFDVTDQEFAAVHEFWKKDNAAQGFLGHMFESEEEIAAPLKTLLGDERFAELQRARDPEFGKIRSLVQRASLPSETADQVYALRAQLEPESARIVGDSSSVAEKLAALQTLARETREKIRAMLGPDAAAAYLPNAERWLALVEGGDSIHFLRNGWEGSPPTLWATPPAPAAPR